MLLQHILANYFTQLQTKRVIHLLKSRGVFDDLDSSARGFYAAANTSAHGGSYLLFPVLLEVYLNTLFRCLEPTPDAETGTNEPSEMVVVVLILLIDAMKFSETPCCEFLTLFEKNLARRQAASSAQPILFPLLGCHLIQLMSAFGNASGAKPLPATVPCLIPLQWNARPDDSKNNINLTRFIFDLMELFPGVGSSAALYALFNDSLLPRLIVMPGHHIAAFLTLFRLLLAAGRISCRHSPGLNVLLQSRFKPKKNEQLPRRHDYRKIKSEALADPVSNKKIMDMLRPIYFKYCQGKKCREKFYSSFRRK